MIKKFSKVFSLVMIMVLCLSMLAGCGEVPEKVPTAEELLTGAFGTSEVQSIRSTVKADIDANIDMSSVGMSGNMTMSCNMNVEMGGNMNGNTFTDGYIDYDMLGMKGTQKVKTYEIVDDYNTKVYTFDDDTNSWTMEHSVAKNGETFIKSIVDMVEVENFADGSLVVEPSENNYTVKGVINSTDLKTSLEALNRLIGSENLISNDLSFNVVMEFDKDTKEIKSMSLALNTETASETIKAAYTNLTMSIEVHEINTVNIELPQEVLDALESDLSYLDESGIEETETVVESENN